MSIFDPAEVVMQKVQTVVAEKGDGQLTIRVTAKRTPGAVVNTSLATFNDSHFQHLANIEGWLPKLVGGGEYTIVVNHATNVGLRYPFTMLLPGNPYPQINTAAVANGDWTGPTNLLNPPVQQMQMEQQPQQQSPFFSSSPTVFQPLPRPQIPTQPAMAQAFQQMPASSGEQLLTVQREEARANEMINKRVADLDRRDTEDRMRREAQDREAKMRAEFAAQLAAIQGAIANKPTVAPPDPMDGFAKLAAAFAPLAQSMIASNTEMKRLQIEQAQRHAEMQAATARELAAIQAKSAEAHNALLMKMLEKPAVDPHMTHMLDMARFNAESQTGMMTQVINATGMVSKMSIGMIETIAEMTAPPEGSPMLDAVKETVKSLAGLIKGADSGARGAVPKPPAPAALPNGVRPQPTPVQLEAAKARAAQVNATAAAQQQARAQPPPAPPSPPAGATAPANVVQFPVQQPPAAPPVAMPPVPLRPEESNASFGDAEPPMPDAFDSIPTKTVVDELRDLITAHHDPVEAVAKFFLDSVPDPAMQAVLHHPDVQGDPSALLATQLGLEWCLDKVNQQYIEDLGDALQTMGEERGMLAPEGEDDDAPPATAVVDAVPEVKEGAP
jgi:hypothetical protein